MDGAVIVHEQGGNAVLADVDNVLQKVVQIQAGTHHADDVVVGIAHEHVYPQLGNAKFGIGIDVQVKVAALVNELEEPGIVGFAGVQYIAELLAGILVIGIVVVVMTVGVKGHKVAVIPEVAAEALHLADGKGFQGWVIGGLGPLNQGRRVGHLPGQPDFPFQGLQQPGAVIAHLDFGHLLAPAFNNIFR